MSSQTIAYVTTLIVRGDLYRFISPNEKRATESLNGHANARSAFPEFITSRQGRVVSANDGSNVGAFHINEVRTPADTEPLLTDQQRRKLVALDTPDTRATVTRDDTRRAERFAAAQRDFYRARDQFDS